MAQDNQMQQYEIRATLQDQLQTNETTHGELQMTQEIEQTREKLQAKTQEAQQASQELQKKKEEIERKDKILLYTLCFLCLTVAVVVVLVVTTNKLWSSLAEREKAIAQLRRSFPPSSCTCQVSSQSATMNYPSQVIVELRDAIGQPCLLAQNVTAEIRVQSIDQSSILPTTIFMRFPSQYEVCYTALSKGQHKLHIQVNGSDVKGSPFKITLYPDPIQLGRPVRIVTGLNGPWDIAINSHGKMVVSNYGSNNVLLFDKKGKQIGTFAYVEHPTGVAIDSNDNVYVASDLKLYRFNKDGLSKKMVWYDKEHPFFRGIAFYHDNVYVCERGNHYIGVYTTDLKSIQHIGSPGLRKGQFCEPYDVDFDSEGNAYISDRGNHQIQVIDTSGKFVRQFGQDEGEGKLDKPTAILVMGPFVYITDHSHDRIAVYQTSGQFVTSFGKHGKGEGEFDAPYGITSDENGFLYVADYNNNRVQVF